MIIGINGYAGSGKDTVGRIIQNLCPEDNWEVKKFADKLKQIASILTNIPQEKFEDQRFKKTYLGKEWWTTCDEGHQPMSVREFLQMLGTDGLRKGLHENVWVNALMADYKKTTDFKTFMYAKEYTEDRKFKNKERIPGSALMEYMTETFYPNWIITDVRFPNEAKAIKDNEGIIIRIDRKGISPINAHASETGLDFWNFDYKIKNDGDLSELTENIKGILKDSKLVKVS